MSVSIDIIPCSGSLDMYGLPDQHAAYSLSGYISITLSSSSSFFERRQAVRVLLQSIVVTFEGQTELVAEEMGYSAFRLCSISKELALGEPIELDNEGSEDPAGHCTWNVTFNLTVPGWLPATTPFGETGGGTQYALHASVAFDYVDDSAQRSWFSIFCSPLRFFSKTLEARVPVHLNRYTSPSMIASSSTSAFPPSLFAVTSRMEQVDEQSNFPADILSKILVQVSIPECIGMEEDSIPFTLRLRTDKLPEADCAKLRATAFSVDVEQIERYRTIPHSTYTTQYPVPPATEQPPHKRLRNPHPVQALYDVGLSMREPANHVLSRTFSRLAADSGQYKVAGDGYIFVHDADKSQNKTWFSLTTSVPLSPHTATPNTEDWKRDRTPRPSEESPFLSVSHRLYVTLTCTYDNGGEDSEPAVQHLRFYIPVRFVRLPPTAPAQSHSPSLSLVSLVSDVASSVRGCSAVYSSSVPDLSPPSAPYAQTLPAYSQLFDSNGDRKIDYSVPLPLYSLHPSDADLKLLPSTGEMEENS